MSESCVERCFFQAAGASRLSGRTAENFRRLKGDFLQPPQAKEVRDPVRSKRFKITAEKVILCLWP